MEGSLTVYFDISGLAIDDVKIFEEFLNEDSGKAEKELDNFLNETHAPDGEMQLWQVFSFFLSVLIGKKFFLDASSHLCPFVCMYVRHNYP